MERYLPTITELPDCCCRMTGNNGGEEDLKADWIFSCPCLVWLMCKTPCLESFVGVESGERLTCNTTVGDNVVGGKKEDGWRANKAHEIFSLTRFFKPDQDSSLVRDGPHRHLSPTDLFLRMITAAGCKRRAKYAGLLQLYGVFRKKKEKRREV